MGERTGFFLVQRIKKDFYHADGLFFLWIVGEWRGPKAYLLVVEQKISDWLIKIMCWGEVETAVGIKFRFGIMGFQHNLTPFWAYGFLFYITRATSSVSCPSIQGRS